MTEVLARERDVGKGVSSAAWVLGPSAHVAALRMAAAYR